MLFFLFEFFKWFARPLDFCLNDGMIFDLFICYVLLHEFEFCSVYFSYDMFIIRFHLAFEFDFDLLPSWHCSNLCWLWLVHHVLMISDFIQNLTHGFTIFTVYLCHSTYIHTYMDAYMCVMALESILVVYVYTRCTWNCSCLCFMYLSLNIDHYVGVYICGLNFMIKLLSLCILLFCIPEACCVVVVSIWSLVRVWIHLYVLHCFHTLS